MRIRVFVTAMVVSTTLFAQKNPMKFGNVPLEQIQMKVYPHDSTAEAVILADVGESTIGYTESQGFQLTFERTIRIKILNREGLEWGNFEIPLYGDGGSQEKALTIKGITYNLENGKVVESKLTNDGKFRERTTENWELIKVTMPDVKEGSVVELNYVVLSDYWRNFQDWTFQSTIPTIVSEYRANIPEYFHYNRYMQGYIVLDVNETRTVSKTINLGSADGRGGYDNSQIHYTETNYRWAAHDIPAFKREPYITTPKDYLSRINFELATISLPNRPIRNYLGSWDEINKKYYEALDPYINGNGFLKSTVEGLTAGLQTTEEKISAITTFVKQNLTWDGGIQMFPGGALRKVFDDKKGSSAELNLILASMLEKAGIVARPVLLSTREHGMIREASAVSSQFNYVICMAEFDGKYVLLDATEKLLPNMLLPERCLNGNGLALGKDRFDWVSLDAKIKTRSAVTADVTLDASRLVGKLKLDHNGYAALGKRKTYFSKGESDYVKDFLGSRQWEVSKTEFKNAEDIQNNFTELHDIVINESITEAGDIIYLDPFVINNLSENPFKSEKRDYPVNFGRSDEQVYTYRLTLPEGYVVEESPGNKMLALPGNGGKFLYNSAVTGNILTITSILTINRSLFTQEEYPVLREFYNQVVAKQAEQIVLRKK